jgi:hypothetical protein
MRLVQETFDLSVAEVNHLLTASIGEGILIMENEHSELKIVSSPREHELITTNADELLRMKGTTLPNKAVAQKTIQIRLDEHYGFYRSTTLSAEEKTFLLNKHYKEYTLTGIKGKKERFFLRPRGHENIQHFFLTMELYELVRMRTQKVWLYETERPDIVFEMKGRKVGVEVETGQHRVGAIKRKAALNSKHYNQWFFVVTDKNLVPKYQSFGKCFHKRNVAKKLEKLLKLSVRQKPREGLRTAKSRVLRVARKGRSR